VTERIFDGLKVIDCASFIAGPAAATVMSDFGAEVVKIEPPGSGDPYRRRATPPIGPGLKSNPGFVLDGRACDGHAPVDRASHERVVPDIEGRTVPFGATAKSGANVQARRGCRDALVLYGRDRHMEQDFVGIAVYGLHVAVLTGESGKITDLAIAVKHRRIGEIEVVGGHEHV